MDKQVERLLEQLGEFGVSAWESAVRYVWIDSLVGLVFGVTMCLVSVWVVCRVGAICSRDGGPSRDDELLVFLGVVLVIILSFVGISYLFCSIPGLLEPEGALVRSLARGGR